VPSITSVQEKQTRATKALKVLSGYANGLAAVTNAADRTAYNAAAKRLEGSVGNLAKFAEPAAPGIGTITPLVVNVFTWAVGEALDQDRFDTLRDAVIFAQGPIKTASGEDLTPVKTAGEALKLGLQAIAVARIAVLDDGIRTLAAPLGPALSTAAYKERRTQTQAMYATLENMRHADAGKAAADMITAHDKLAEAVKDPKRNFGQLMEAVGEFVKKANDVQAAMAAPAK
jgi:hypothetical protein